MSTKILIFRAFITKLRLGKWRGGGFRRNDAKELIPDLKPLKRNSKRKNTIPKPINRVPRTPAPVESVTLIFILNSQNRKCQNQKQQKFTVNSSKDQKSGTKQEKIETSKTMLQCKNPPHILGLRKKWMNALLNQKLTPTTETQAIKYHLLIINLGKTKSQR